MFGGSRRTILSDLYPSFSPSWLRSEVHELLERRQRPSQARDLYLFAGVVGGLLAKASHDFADPHAAMTQARAAFMCAEHSDHDGLRAWLRGLQTLVAYWAGRHQESVEFARSGSDYAARARSTVSVWLLVSEARSLAAMGNANDAQAAIQRAEMTWADVRSDELDELGGICTFSRARQLYYSADAYAWLPGQSEIAESYSTAAVDAYADPSDSDWAFGDQAGAYASSPLPGWVTARLRVRIRLSVLFLHSLQTGGSMEWSTLRFGFTMLSAGRKRPIAPVSPRPAKLSKPLPVPRSPQFADRPR